MWLWTQGGAWKRLKTEAEVGSWLTDVEDVEELGPAWMSRVISGLECVL